MHDGWRTESLEHLLTRPNDRGTPVDDLQEVRYAGVRLYAQGVYERETVSAAKIKAKQLWWLQEDDVIYNRMWATKASFGIVGPEAAGCYVTNDFPIFRARSGVALPAYIGLIFQSAEFQAMAASAAVGTTDRKRLHERDLLRLQLQVPQVDEQRRIVDLIRQLDRATAAYTAAREAAATLLVLVLEPGQPAAAEPTAPLESVFRHVIGGAWGEPPGVAEVDVLALGPSAYAERREVDLSRAKPRSLSSKRAADRTLLPDDIVLERSGGTPTQPVGRVIRMTTRSSTPVVPSDFQRLLRPDPEVAEPAYVFWQMWANYQAGRTVPFQKATTNIRNLNIPDYLRQTAIALPDRGEQRRVVALADSAAVTIDYHSSALDSLAGLRSNLLGALLSGEHEIPESYGDLLAG